MSITYLSLKHGGMTHQKPNLRKTRVKFIEQSNEIHSNKYNYDLVVYIRNEDYVIIECPAHGYFLQAPRVHLRGRGCKKCGGEKRRLTTEEFIEKSNLIHSNKYSYSKSIYVKKRTPLIITCPKHGDFIQNPSDHLAGSGCSECAKRLTSWRKTQYEEMAKKHGGYSNLYLAEMKSSNECFYKIGITVFDVKARYWGENDYRVSVISTVVLPALSAWEKEREIHSKLKGLKYNPLIKFGGYTECFSELTQEVKDFFGVVA